MKIVNIGCMLGCVVLGGCGAAPEEEAVFDKNARQYRMYFDNDATDGNQAFEARKFNGQLRLESVETIFGNLEDLPLDKNQNRVGGWKLHDDLLWSIVAGPSLQAVNIMTIGLDGTFNSTWDLDGDSIADIVDIRLADGSRFSFVTEHAGRGVFERWLAGENPLCHEGSIAGLNLPLFGCDDAGSGSSGGGSAGSGSFGGAGIYDPFDHLCDDYNTGRAGLRPPVMAHGGHGYGRMRPWTWTESTRENGVRQNTVGTAVYEDADGNHVSTTKVITYYNEEGDVTRVIRERVSHDGQGTRTVTDHGADGTTKTERETFETEVDENGDYGPAPEDHERAPAEAPPSTETPGSDTTDPGPGGNPGDPTGGMAQWCADRGDFVSGAERAAGTDHAAFNVDCQDFVTQSNASGNCTVLEWARPANFSGATEVPSASSGCGPFEQPGPDGSCGAASGIQRLRGNAAWFGSIDLQAIEICNPLVCNPGI